MEPLSFGEHTPELSFSISAFSSSEALVCQIRISTDFPGLGHRNAGEFNYGKECLAKEDERRRD